MWISSSQSNKRAGRKRAAIAAALLASLLLSACGAALPGSEKVQVSLVETQGMTVEENGLWVTPGDSAVFTVALSKNVRLAGLDYDGAYTVTRENGRMRIELFDLRYPTRVRLNLTSHYRTIHYVSGEDSFTVNYDVSSRKRPNTATTMDGQKREGYTLLAWRTEAGERIGLGSRVSAEALETTLYADWVPWTAVECFTLEDGTLTGYAGEEERIVIPETVTAIAAGAFVGAAARELVLPRSLRTVEDGAFQGCAFESVTLFDSIETISDAAFVDCPQLQTLYINAAERPYGAQFRRESVYADKVELLLNARGQRKLVFFGGCSMWYNLDSTLIQQAFGEDYAVINLGLNGTVSGLVQMEILEAFLEEGDVLFHTPELSSYRQLLTKTDMSDYDIHLWCGLEYNYDLFRLVDIRGMGGVFDSLCQYLGMKKGGGSYYDVYQDEEKRTYMDAIGGLPVYRGAQLSSLVRERVELDGEYLGDGARLRAMYDRLSEKGVTVLVGYACVNLDEAPDEQRERVEEMDALVRETLAPYPVVSSLSDYLYHDGDFYDTNYHLLSQPARQNTEKWIRDLEAALAEEK